MKPLLITIAAVLLVGCGESQPPEPPTAKAPEISIHKAAGADVNGKAEERLAPASGHQSNPVSELDSGLLDAAENGNLEAVQKHLAAGIDFELKCTGCGGTALLHAAFGGHKEIVELLIAKGADVNPKNDRGQTPLDWADKEIAALLRKHGGKTAEELEAEEAERKPFMPNSVVKLNEEEVKKVLMLFVGESVGREEHDYLKEISMKFKIRNLLDWEKEGSSIAGIKEMTERTKGKLIINERVYYDYESNLFVNEQTNNNETVQSFGIWDAKVMTMNWYFENNEMRGETKQIFTGPRQSTSKTKLWNRVGSKWKLLANGTLEFQPLASDGSHEEK